MRTLALLAILVAFFSAASMAANPFGAKPGETYDEYQDRKLRELNVKRIEAGLEPINVDPKTGEGIDFLVHGGGLREFKENKMAEIPQRQGVNADMLKAIENLLGGSTPLTKENEMLGFGQEPENPLQHILLRAIEAKRLREGSPGGTAMPVGVGMGEGQLPGTPSTDMDHRIATLKLILEALNPFGKDPSGPGTVGDPGIDPDQL